MIDKNMLILLINEKSEKFVVKVTGEFEVVKGLGVIDTSRFLNKQVGDTIQILDNIFKIGLPTIEDMLQRFARSAQVIASKDIAQILFKCNIKSGAVVIEGGAGSGFLSVALLNAIKPDGMLITYELRSDFVEFAKKNILQTGLEKYWVVKLENVENISETDVDTVILDIPQPWKAVKSAYKALKTSGWFCAYVPTVAQMENTGNALKLHNFSDIEAKEILERKWVIGKLGSRPETKMLGHTGFLVFARKI